MLTGNLSFRSWLRTFVVLIYLISLALVIAIWKVQSTHASNFTSTQSGSWGNAATWGGAGIPGAGDNVIISVGHTVTEDGNRTCGDLTVNGTLDMTNDFLFFQGTTLTNSGALTSSVGFGDIRFNGVGGAAGTTQNLAGTGIYNLNSKRVDLNLINNVTVIPASSTILDGVTNFGVFGGSVLSLSNTLVFKNGTTINNGGSISGAGTLQTQGPVTLSSTVGNISAPFEAVSGTTMGSGNFGKMTIDAGATFQQNQNLTPNGDLIVVSGATLDMANDFLFFQGTTFTNNGALTSSVGFGEIRFQGVGGAAGTTQNLAGTGIYNLNSKRVDINLINNVTVTPASGTILDGITNFGIFGGSVLSLPNTLVFKNGTTINNGGSISGAGTLQTQGPVTLISTVGNITAPFEAVSGTTMGSGNFGKMTIDSGATFQQNQNLTPNGDLVVVSSATLDMNNGFLFFQGTTFTNNGALTNSVNFGDFRFNGVGGVAGTTQNIAGTGTYNTNGRVDINLINNVTVTPASGTILNGVTNLGIFGGTTFDFTGSGGITLAGSLSNAGTFKLNGGGAACGDTTKILIRSSIAGTQRAWSGGGNFLLTDVDVKDQAGTAIITDTGGVNSGNNGVNWSFLPCASTLQFSAAAYPVGEGAQRVDTTVTRLGDTSGAASVSFATSDLAGTQNCNVINGAASSRCDYEIRLKTVKFAAGETSKTVSVFIVDDAYLEGPETFAVNLSNPSGATLGTPSTATVTITDNDLANGVNPIDTATFFVRLHYLDFLNREPDTDGFNFWTNQITSCGANQQCIEGNRINVSASFFLSIEFQQTGYLVERIYKASYGDANGTSTFGGSHSLTVPIVRLNEFLLDTQQIGEGVIVLQPGWETVLENNKQAFTLDFVQRSRFTAAFPTSLTPAQFVDALFANSGVTPSTTDRNAAIAEFNSAPNTSDVAARSRALRRVAENSTLAQQEFNRAFVLMQYYGYLRRNPNDFQDSDYTGYDFWLTKLNQFNGNYINAEMVKAFITSIEYRQRFGP